MLDDFSFVAAVSGLPVPVTPGESVHLAANSEVIFKLQLRRTAKTRGQPLKVEFIGNMRSGTPQSLVVADINPEKDSFEWKPATLVPGRDGKTAYVRARVFAKDASGETLAAYANPIRFVLRK